MRIGELGKATATKIETIRYYEQTGLLPLPARTSGNYRNYGEAHMARLSFIRRARALGFGIAQVRSLLDLSDDRTSDSATVDRIATKHLKDVDRKIADLSALRRELSALVASCEGGAVAHCRIVEALGPIDRGDNSV